MSEQAKEDSDEGAAAFVDYWIEVSNYAAETGDVEELDRLSAQECTGCDSYIDLYRSTYADGGFFRGADWTFSDLRVGSQDGVYYVTVEMTYGEGEYRESSESEVVVTKSGGSEISFAVADGQVTQLALGGVQ